jgi:transcriptional regulator with XRE-family HTH domain
VNSDRRVGRNKTSAMLEPNLQLRNLMLSWRLRLDPDRIAGLADQRRRTVTQETVADRVGVSPLWYGRLERGELDRNYSDEMLERVAFTLRLSDDERIMLFLLAAGHEPPPRVRPPRRVLGEGLEKLVNVIPYPAWISDRAWDILLHNDAMMDWLPHIAYESNVMRWVFAFPESRMQLVDWEGTWAPRMLAQMRVAHARWPEDQRLNEIVEEALAVNEAARRMWDETRVYSHPDGDRRLLHLPGGRGICEVEIVAMPPMRDPELRLVTLVPVGGNEPDE